MLIVHLPPVLLQLQLVRSVQHFPRLLVGLQWAPVDIAGVSESIIMGIPVPCGTGMTKLVYTPPINLQPRRRPDPVLEGG